MAGLEGGEREEEGLERRAGRRPAQGGFGVGEQRLVHGREHRSTRACLVESAGRPCRRRRRPAGDFLHLRLEPGLGEDRLGRDQDPLPVSAGTARTARSVAAVPMALAVRSGLITLRNCHLLAQAGPPRRLGAERGRAQPGAVQRTQARSREARHRGGGRLRRRHPVRRTRRVRAGRSRVLPRTSRPRSVVVAAKRRQRPGVAVATAAEHT